MNELKWKSTAIDVTGLTHSINRRGLLLTANVILISFLIALLIPRNSHTSHIWKITAIEVLFASLYVEMIPLTVRIKKRMIAGFQPGTKDDRYHTTPARALKSVYLTVFCYVIVAPILGLMALFTGADKLVFLAAEASAIVNFMIVRFKESDVRTLLNKLSL